MTDLGEMDYLGIDRKRVREKQNDRPRKWNRGIDKRI